MNTTLLIIGVVFLIMGFLVGVLKMTWLLSGFNEKRVKDKTKLAHLVGFSEIAIGIVLITLAIIGVKETETLLLISVGILLSLLVYTNVKMVE